MPFASFKNVTEVSSEDPAHLSTNLLKEMSNKSWRTKTPGEKSAYVVLEMEDEHYITGIDIGNEHSAFIQVLVGKERSLQTDFKEILLAFSIMTPYESRSTQNPNRVRFFNKDALVSSVASEKWKFVKIICTQPFNKFVQYGISFIKLHINKESSNKILQQSKSTDSSTLQSQPLTHFGKFLLREESPDIQLNLSNINSNSTTSLFDRWRNSSSSTSNSNNESEYIPKKKFKSSSNQDEEKKVDYNIEKKTNDISMDETDDDKEINSAIRRTSPDRGVLPTFKNKKVERKIRETCASNKNTSDVSMSDKPIKNRNQTPKTSVVYRPFNKLLDKVVFVISGIQNPERAEIRKKALAMGAIYKSDWVNGCTHLVCAFKNTPKYNQIKGAGKIVNRNWIEKCFTSRKYIPWRRYALDDLDGKQPESDTEIFEETENLNEPNKSLDKSEQNLKKKNLLNKRSIKDNSSIYDTTTDEEDYLKERNKYD